MRAQKVIVITGTSRGLGRELALSLTSQGYRVVGLVRKLTNPEALRFLEVQCDITNKMDVGLALLTIQNYVGPIGMVINNAGVMNFKSLVDYGEKDFDETFAVNVKAALFVSQEAIYHMKSQKDGYIINIGSTRAITSAPNKALYSMSKFALRSLTQSINIEYNKDGIYSTLICPGAIDKEGIDKTKVQYSDVINVVNYLMTVPISARVPEIILGGQL